MLERNIVWSGVAIPPVPQPRSLPEAGVLRAFRHPSRPPVPPLRYPLYAGLLVGDVRHDALEFSAAGMSLAVPMMEKAGLHHLRRGDECEAVLCIGGAGWQEEYDVVLRLAVRGPAIAGFAFVGLPPLARLVLERHEANPGSAEEAWGDDAPDDLFAGGTAPFAFARLAEPAETSRRFILSISEAVFALTQRRNQPDPPPNAPADPPPAPSVRPRRRPSTTTAAGTALVYAVALLALLLIVVVMTFG